MSAMFVIGLVLLVLAALGLAAFGLELKRIDVRTRQRLLRQEES